VPLRDGTRVTLRPIEAGDKERLADGFERMSEDSRYRRFFSPSPTLGSSMLRYLTELDHHDHEAVIALEAETGRSVGVARFVRDHDAPTEAEAAVTVVDDFQGRGAGRVLLDALTDRARQEGIATFTALAQADNPRAIRALEGIGSCRRSSEGPYVHLRVALPERGSGGSLERALHAAAQGTLMAAGALAHRLGKFARWPGRRGRPHPERRITTVVAGTDGSPTAAHAIERAVRVAGGFGATLHVVCAYGDIRLPGPFEVASRDVAELAWIAQSREWAADVAEQAAAGARTAGLHPVAHARRGEPADAIIRVAEAEDADLIVVGSRGMGRARRHLLGSVPDKVARHAPCSVLIARTG